MPVPEISPVVVFVKKQIFACDVGFESRNSARRSIDEAMTLVSENLIEPDNKLVAEMVVDHLKFPLDDLRQTFRDEDQERNPFKEWAPLELIYLFDIAGQKELTRARASLAKQRARGLYFGEEDLGGMIGFYERQIDRLESGLKEMRGFGTQLRSGEMQSETV